jgi:hypothetical protein
VPPHGQIKFDCRQVNGGKFHRRQFGAAQIMRSEKGVQEALQTSKRFI